MMIVDGEKDGAEGASETFADFEARAAGNEPGGEEEGDEEDDSEAGDEGDEEDDSEAGDEGGEEDDSEAGDEGGEKPKPKKGAKERIRELVARNRELERNARGFEARLAALETGKNPLTDADESGNEADEAEAPDPKDLEKYPLGALDDRYLEDKLEWLSDRKTKAALDSLLQRQEQTEEQKAAEAMLADLRSKADNVVAKGSEIIDDYESVVLEAGIRGDYDLTQITFEAISEAEHGAQILHGLALDPEEATRVARLSPVQQVKYVTQKDAELSKGAAKGKLPGAKPPPSKTPRGGQSRKTISPATSNFKDFERLAEGKN